jgi:hypothetical protein
MDAQGPREDNESLPLDRLRGSPGMEVLADMEESPMASTSWWSRNPRSQDVCQRIAHAMAMASTNWHIPLLFAAICQ